MAIEERASVEIDAVAAVVFERLIDVGRWPEWFIASGIVRVVRVPDASGPLAIDSRLVIEQRLAGVRTSTIDARVAALEVPSRFAVHGRDADGIGVEIDATIEPLAAGCRLDWRLRIELPLRYRAFGSMVAPQVRRAVALDLEAFRRSFRDSETPVQADP
jgi:hypothetical protein